MRVALGALLSVCLAFGQNAAKPTELQRAIEEFKIQSRDMGLREDSPPSTRHVNGARKWRWHGRLYENFRNDFLDAVPHEVFQRGGSKGILRRNQYGFNLTGPLYLPKVYDGGRNTFFTFTFEGTREKIGRTALLTIPTMAERAGDWSSTVDAAGQLLPIYDPQTTMKNPAFDSAQDVSAANLEYNRAPFPGNRIPPSRLDPTAQKALLLYPAPNTNAGPFFQNNFFVLSPEVNSAAGVIVSLDHTLNDKQRLTFHVTYSNGVDGAFRYFDSVANPSSPIVDRRSRSAALRHVVTLSAQSVNTFSASASTGQTEYEREPADDGQPFPKYRFSPYLSMGRTNPSSRSARNTYSVSDGFSWRRGSHRLGISTQLIAEQVNIYAPQFPTGDFEFSSGLTSLPGIINTGHAFASFLLGDAYFAQKSEVISPSYFRKPRYLLSGGDQWEVGKGLTLSFGLTLDSTGPRTEKYDRQSTIDLNVLNPANSLPGALVTAGRNGAGRGFQPWLSKLDPSASLVWTFPNKTLARASYSRSYSPIPVYTSQWGTQAFNGTPTWISANPQLTPAATLAGGLGSASQTFPDTRLDAANDTVADLIEPTGRQPTYQSAGISLERELPGPFLVTMGFDHSEGRNLLLSNSAANPNAISLSALDYRDQLNNEAFKKSLRPYPQYQRFDVHSSWPEGRYKRDAGYVRVEKRSSGGISLSATYQFAKQMDDYSGPYGIQDYYNRGNEWSLTAGSIPHRLSLSYAYELPFGPNRLLFRSTDWRRYFVEGWSVSGVTTVTSGEPIGLHPQFNNTGGVVDALNVNVVPGVDAHVPNPGPELWFNPAAFSQPADFTVGDASRTHPSLRLPGNQNHDVSISKRLPLGQEQSLELSVVGLNFLNHANWNDPDTVIGPASAPNVNAGRIIGSRGGRVMQLGMRFSF
ncbi:MAG: hypothetical protein ABJF23_00945 [Bryobacteraceae bacterium]